MLTYSRLNIDNSCFTKDTICNCVLFRFGVESFSCCTQLVACPNSLCWLWFCRIISLNGYSLVQVLHTVSRRWANILTLCWRFVRPADTKHSSGHAFYLPCCAYSTQHFALETYLVHLHVVLEAGTLSLLSQVIGQCYFVWATKQLCRYASRPICCSATTWIYPRKVSCIATALFYVQSHKWKEQLQVRLFCFVLFQLFLKCCIRWTKLSTSGIWIWCFSSGCVVTFWSGVSSPYNVLSGLRSSLAYCDLARLAMSPYTCSAFVVSRLRDLAAKMMRYEFASIWTSASCNLCNWTAFYTIWEELVLQDHVSIAHLVLSSLCCRRGLLSLYLAKDPLILLSDCSSLAMRLYLQGHG